MQNDKKLFLPTPLLPGILEAARSLRRKMTDAERLLWHCLRRKQLGGFRFRRQHPFDHFILDFYCAEVKLAIELDGGHHNEPTARVRDSERTAYLSAQGIQVLRFWNSEIHDNLEGVLLRIYEELMARGADPCRSNPAPPP